MGGITILSNRREDYADVSIKTGAQTDASKNDCIVIPDEKERPSQKQGLAAKNDSTVYRAKALPGGQKVLQIGGEKTASPSEKPGQRMDYYLNGSPKVIQRASLNQRCCSPKTSTPKPSSSLKNSRKNILNSTVMKRLTKLKDLKNVPGKNSTYWNSGGSSNISIISNSSSVPQISKVKNNNSEKLETNETPEGT